MPRVGSDVTVVDGVGLCRYGERHGQYHHVSARYLYQHAAEAAWKEDNHRLPNDDAFRRTLGLAMASPVSRQWRGCWQRNEG